ncbi:MAG: hypothetical protein RLZZ495_571 [Pseudomonadota bacterium]
MPLPLNAPFIARQAMGEINPNLASQYVTVIEFLSHYPEAASAMRGKNSPSIGSVEYIERQAEAFALARNPRAPQAPATIPDAMVSVILHAYFDIPIQQLEYAKHVHQLAMGAENLVGDLLERYLASVLEPHGWIWCSGAMVKAVDFILPPSTSGGSWRMLQVKNRDNSENSSSSAIRAGTEIEKWHRTFSKKAGANWSVFPDERLKTELSEENFERFVRTYLHAIRQQQQS